MGNGAEAENDSHFTACYGLMSQTPRAVPPFCT
jgi:hypothetical protein